VDVVTGFPGFIGRRLVARLLADEPGARVVALVQGSMLDAARACAQAIDAGRIELVVGDIADRRLGLDAPTYARLCRDARRVFHLAAIYDLSVPLEAAQRVNVDGTGNVLDLCRAAAGLERLVYVSTAYVAGRRTGVVYEHELVMGQDFKNNYEATKFQAEVWVRQALADVPTTILRPAIVVGDSRTGETEKFDGPYFILRAISRARRLGAAIPQFGRSRAAFNVVPVDYVVEASAVAARDPATVGETLHLVDPDPLSAAELVELLSREYAQRPPRGRVPARLVEGSLRIGPVREAFAGVPPESIAYLNHPVTYDARRTVDLLRPHGLIPPRFPDYAAAVVRFFAAHEHDRAYRPRGT
jgi:nucleoside-diphosphate-sugar epimerase